MSAPLRLAAMGFQPAVTELARDLQWLDGMINIIITAIVLFVLGLILWCIVRYNKKANPTPAAFTHNTPVEIAWTLVPILVLVFIGAFSLPVLFKQQEIPEGDVFIKATGYQWYWGYEYPEEGFSFDSYMIGSPATGGDNSYNEEVEMQLVEAGYEPEHFLLATDTQVVVPVGKTVVVQVTGGDVIHSWTIPAFGVKQDGIPGRLAELWFEAEREGIYFGQCPALRHRACLHADHRESGQRRGIRPVAGADARGIRLERSCTRHGRADPDRFTE